MDLGLLQRSSQTSSLLIFHRRTPCRSHRPAPRQRWSNSRPARRQCHTTFPPVCTATRPGFSRPPHHHTPAFYCRRRSSTRQTSAARRPPLVEGQCSGSPRLDGPPGVEESSDWTAELRQPLLDYFKQRRRYQIFRTSTISLSLRHVSMNFTIPFHYQFVKSSKTTSLQQTLYSMIGINSTHTVYVKW